ncbi:universal stress protein [Pseudaminobacter arsenicus]|uniref:Universal stress protein n=1 Tax=Borborobacter arsenicus TaxID=1851146 RepID=A0A432V1A3_9HYPH|nr:universal stress protein [Pseudaminobacter arsenicus]RUM95977.1 universal stress protein [Pseudaminobacter arsenicus]
MIYNTIMVQLDIDAPATPRLTFAWELAQNLEADLIAFAAAEPFLVRPADGDGSISAEATRSQVEQIEERLKALKSEFHDLTQDSNRASWRGTVGEPTRFLALNARAADLLVVGPVGHSPKDRLRTIDPGELILSAGRPVLFASDGYRPLTAENVLVAWKDSREARRAVIDAMPFLANARQVLVASIEESDRAQTRESAADVVRFLMKHGVKARSQMLEAGGADFAEALLQATVETGADLIVSGGYGHSRLREWAFGGVTRSLLQDSSINRLIAN